MIRLCSSSQTRAKLLNDFNIAFVQSSCDFDEDVIKHLDPKAFVYEAAKGKFECCKKKYGLQMPLLAADTVVQCQNQLLRKPKDKADAKRMLSLQSGSEVSIITSLFFEKKELFLSDISKTTYKMAPFDETDLQNYLKSDEWMGKAGGVMVEGFCKKYIQSVEGLESTAMGLQVQKLLPYV